MKKNNFTCLIVVAVVGAVGLVGLAILAAVAIPMYEKFQQKVVTASAIKGAIGSRAAFQSYFDTIGSFEGVKLEGESLYGTDMGGNSLNVGYMLPKIEDLTWQLETSVNQVDIRWRVGSQLCMNGLCDGVYCLNCSNGNCSLAIQVADPSMHSLNRKEGEIKCSF